MNPHQSAGEAARSPTVAVIVAHPDDETLWCGGTIMMHPGWSWEVVSLCRAGDPDRAPRFGRALDALGAAGRMADLDDGPEQLPLDPELVGNTILALLSRRRYDLLLTHSLRGEYTRHRRHEETGQAVCKLWQSGRLDTGQLWMFAYRDGGRRHLPRAAPDAHRSDRLPAAVWTAKHSLITGIYGFAPDGFEARTCPKLEAFWCFDSPDSVSPHFDRTAEQP